jgi:hypothetical protein
MNKNEFLAASLPYSLKCLYKKTTFLVSEISLWTVGTNFPTSDCKPIVRHMDDLTKPIVQADYNDGKPFIPIVELGKLFVNGGYWYIDECGTTVADEDNYFFLSYSDGDGYFYCEDLNTGSLVSVNQLQFFQHLIKWHFNLIDGSEVVYVTEDFNPYK